MEKNIKNNILKKIAIILLAIVICYFIIPTPVNAASFLVEAGGDLIDWILDLFIFLGDCILDLLQNNFISSQDAIIQAEADSQGGATPASWISIILGIVVIAIGVCIAIASFGTLSWASLAAIAGSIKVIGGVVLATVGGAALFVQGTDKLIDELSGKFDLPMIRYTPFEIFSGQIPVFDVNFIEPIDEIISYDERNTNEMKLVESRKNILVMSTTSNTDEEVEEYFNKDAEAFVKRIYELQDYASENGYSYVTELKTGNEVSNSEYRGICDEYIHTFKQLDRKGNPVDVFEAVSWTKTDGLPEEYYRYNEIFMYGVISHKTEIKDGGSKDIDTAINEIIKERNYQEYDSKKEESNDTVYRGKFNDGKSEYKLVVTEDEYGVDVDIYEKRDEMTKAVAKIYKSSASILQSGISTWYRVLRTVALVGLLSVVVYVGIRILLTSIAADKAKYKKMLVDWVVAICILFILHYLMTFILTVSTSLTKIFMAKGEENIIVALPKDTTINGNQLEASGSNDPEFKDKPVWSTSFVGYIRLLAGSYKAGENNAGLMHIAYGIIYIVLVIYTIMFTFMYLRRAIYMAFLTMIAPLIALTYPLDRIKDGKAQAFALWIREYIFNCLMQPLHLILYTMLISIVMEYIQDHPVYALVALGFLIPAEQFLRKMFGFERAGTVNELGKLAGGAALMTGINKLSNLNKRRQSDESEDEKDTSKVRTQDKDAYSLDIPSSRNSNPPSSGGQSHSSTVRNQTTQQVNLGQDYHNTTTENIHQVREVDSQQISNFQTQNNTENINNEQSEQNILNERNIPNIVNEGDTSNIVNQNNTQNVAGGNSASISTQSNQNKIGVLGRTFAGLNSVGQHYKRRAIKSKPLKTIGKWTGSIVGGAAIGAIGLAAGIASGDVGKAFSYTAAGAGVGGALGGTVSENLMDEASSIKNNFSKGFQGETEYTNAKLDDEFFASTEYQRILNDHKLYPELLTDPRKHPERMRRLKEDIMQYRKSGITDTKKIVKAMKLKLSPRQGAYAIQLADRIGKSGWNKEDTRLEYQEKYYRILYKELGNDEEVKKIWEAIPKLLF